tara:strand:- start:982 stop:1158 length:177 start_codon:yes stop_codon:yes gene_type:complete
MSTAPDLGFGSPTNASQSPERADIGSSRTGDTTISVTEEPTMTSSQQFLSPSNPRGTS